MTDTKVKFMKNHYLKQFVLLFLGIACVAGSSDFSNAAPTSCGVNYYSHEAPEILNEKLNVRVVEICHDGFGVFHSGITATPLWSAEHLTADRVKQAKAIDRVDRFYAETSIPSRDRAELNHYVRSGYDRGHLVPSGDMATVRSQANSFSLSNIVPQNPALNRNLWAEIEATTRGLALKYDDVYVVTGVAFQGSNLSVLKKRVIVPSALYKAIYIPSVDMAAVWWAPNVDPGTSFEVISVDELSSRINVDVFPQLNPRVKALAVKLPKPSKYADRAAGSRGSSKSNEQAGSEFNNQKSAKSEDENAVLKEFGKRILVDVVKGVLK
jgi:endonuclease G